MTIALSILFGLISMVSFGLANAYSKPLSQKLGPAQMLFLREFAILPVLLAVSIPSFHYLQHWQVAVAAVLLGVAGYLPVLAFTHAVKESPLGIVAPIAGTSPLVLVLLSVLFLNTTISQLQWLAVALVILANIIVSVDPKNWRQSRLLQKSSGIPFALFAALGWGLFFVFLVPVSRTLGPWLAALLPECGVALAAGLHVFLSKQPIHLADGFKPLVLVNGLCICGGVLGFTIGVRYFNAAIVGVLGNSTALISTLLGMYLFKESLHLKERIAAVVMILGIAAISL